MEQAYVYQWVEKTTGKWYIGSRTRKGCHPDDGYICSSKTVKPLIQENPDGWIRDILYIGNPIEALKIESFVLCEMKAKDNDGSYNLHNQNLNFHGIKRQKTPEDRARISALFKGKPSHWRGKKNKSVSEANKLRAGIKRPNHAKWMTGRTWECAEKECPYCGIIGRGGNMLRFHFENCKQKGKENGID